MMPKPKLHQLADDIESFEGFRVAVVSKNGPPKKVPPYEYARIARNSHTVADYLRRRIEPFYPGVEVRVLLPDGRVASPRTLLSKARGLPSK